MKGKRTATILLILGAVSGPLCPNLPAQILEQTFSENIADFSISTPNSQWFFTPRSITPGPLRATLRFQSPINKFVPNVTVRVRPVADPKAKLKEWVEEDLKHLPKEMQIIEKKQISHQNWNGFQIQMIDPHEKMHFLQWVFLEKGKNFVVTGVAKESSWPRVGGDIKMILNSFEIR